MLGSQVNDSNSPGSTCLEVLGWWPGVSHQNEAPRKRMACYTSILLKYSLAIVLYIFTVSTAYL